MKTESEVNQKAINEIEVISPEILNTMETIEFTPAIDLSSLSEEQLLAALEAKKKRKTDDRAAYKQLVLETVPKAVFKLCAASEMLTKAKTETFQFFEQILDLKNKTFDIKEKQRSHTFSTDREEIVIGYRVNDGWDDTVTAGIDKVNKYISGLVTNPETAALVKMVQNLLKADGKGNLKANRVLDLQKLTAEFNDPIFSDGVDIISKAYKPVRSSWFIEAYLLNDDGTKVSIPLSMSSVKFAADYTFDFFTEKLPTDEHSNN